MGDFKKVEKINLIFRLCQIQNEKPRKQEEIKEELITRRQPNNLQFAQPLEKTICRTVLFGMKANFITREM
jgi:hypothetical protein